MARNNLLTSNQGNENYWCEIPGDKFQRGSSLNPNEQPILEVQLSSYSVGRYPVTNREFLQFIEAGGYKNKAFWTELGWENKTRFNWVHPNYWHDENWNNPNCPVTGVSWWEAMAFAVWAGASLPSETQWEFAAKGTDGRKYPWGDDEPELSLANYAPECEPPYRESKPADAFPQNCSPFGCIGMAGNLGEWCLDNSRFDYYGDTSHVDPVFYSEEQEDHILRGGCWLHDEDYLSCTSRDFYPPGLRDNIVGFRLCK